MKKWWVSKREKERRKLAWADGFGWLGAALLIGAYIMVSFGILSADNVWYQVLNGVAAVGLLVDGVARRALPSAATNVVWLIIAAVALVGILV